MALDLGGPPGVGGTGENGEGYMMQEMVMGQVSFFLFLFVCSGTHLDVSNSGHLHVSTFFGNRNYRIDRGGTGSDLLSVGYNGGDSGGNGDEDR